MESTSGLKCEEAFPCLIDGADGLLVQRDVQAVRRDQHFESNS